MPVTTMMNERLDRLEIRDLIERFYDATNHQEWAVAEALFTEDAIWETLPPVGWRLEGRAAIREAFSRNTGTIQVLVQTVSPIVIELEGADRARARTTLNEVLRFRETGRNMQIVGTYVDTLVKQDGAWRIAHRTFQLRYEAEAPVPDRIVGVGAGGSGDDGAAGAGIEGAEGDR